MAFLFPKPRPSTEVHMSVSKRGLGLVLQMESFTGGAREKTKEKWVEPSLVVLWAPVWGAPSSFWCLLPKPASGLGLGYQLIRPQSWMWVQTCDEASRFQDEPHMEVCAPVTQFGLKTQGSDSRVVLRSHRGSLSTQPAVSTNALLNAHICTQTTTSACPWWNKCSPWCHSMNFMNQNLRRLDWLSNILWNVHCSPQSHVTQLQSVHRIGWHQQFCKNPKACQVEVSRTLSLAHAEVEPTGLFLELQLLQSVLQEMLSTSSTTGTLRVY